LVVGDDRHDVEVVAHALRPSSPDISEISAIARVSTASLT
jgi:hypothetical protein